MDLDHIHEALCYSPDHRLAVYDRGSHLTSEGEGGECWIHLKIPPTCCGTSPSKKGDPQVWAHYPTQGPSAQMDSRICHSPSPHLVSTVTGLRRAVNSRGSRAGPTALRQAWQTCSAESQTGNIFSCAGQTVSVAAPQLHHCSS